METKELKQLITVVEYASQFHGGCTVNLKAEPAKKGFAIGGIVKEQIGNFSETGDFIKKYMEYFEQGYYIGTYEEEPRQIVFDVIKIEQDAFKAIKLGIKMHQRSIYDLNHNKVILLPSPQTSGTYTQKEAYANQKADEIIAKLKKENYA